MKPDFLELPTAPAAPERRDSLRHFKINLSVRKAWAIPAALSALGSTILYLVGSIPYVWSWEKHQVTDEQLGHVLYDSVDPKTREPNIAPKFDEARLPPDGVVTRIMVLEDSNQELKDSLAAAKRETAALRQLIVDQYRWRVRMQAASSEPDARKRKDSSDRSEAKFMHAVESGKPLDEAYRLALERNPYQ